MGGWAYEDRARRRHVRLRRAGKRILHAVWVVVVVVVSLVLLLVIGDFLWHQVVTAPRPSSCQTAASSNGGC